MSENVQDVEGAGARGGVHGGHAHGASEEVDVQPHQHAFFIAGSRQLFLVHMGNLWMAPHRYQLVLHISVPEEVHRRLLADRAAHPNDWYIIGNEASNAFALPVLPRGQVTVFTGSIWRGFPTVAGTHHWPWANTPPVVANFQVTVQRVLYYRHLDFNLEYPSKATYLLFGAGDEAHLHHLVTRQPDYDHVVSLERVPSWLPPLLLETCVSVSFPSIPAVPAGNVPVYTEDPIAKGEQYVQFGGIGAERPISVGPTVFFGTWPINETDPAGS